MENSSQARATIAIAIPDQTVEVIAERVADLLAGSFEPETWLGVEQAAVRLACPKSRIYALVFARRIPHERDGSRLLFRRSDLDAWVARGGARRP